MKFLIITNAPTLKKANKYYAYAPYANEMNIWCKYAKEVAIVSPTSYPDKLLLASFNKTPKIYAIPSIAFTTLKMSLRSVVNLPSIIYKLFKAMYWADHIHLRCPGNIGLLGCMIQFFYPKKIKTAKYAGNWDPNASQPFSYRLQKKILSNVFLTKNIDVLVYGNWPEQTKNIKPFFTATYGYSDIEVIRAKDFSKIKRFVFIGTLVEGKRPLLAVKIVKRLREQGFNVYLDLYGEGPLRDKLEHYITINNLSKYIILKGNQDKVVIKSALKKSNFLILPSQSEGWPKVVAEAMFFGVIPIVTRVSCVPYMLDEGKRGILIEADLNRDISTIASNLKNEEVLKQMSILAQKWSQNYTTDVFEREIEKLMKR